MAWSPLAGGDLFLKSNEKIFNHLESIAKTFGVEPGTVAIAWLLAHPANILPVLGTNSLARIETISKAVFESSRRVSTVFEMTSGFSRTSSAQPRVIPNRFYVLAEDIFAYFSQ